MNNKKTKKTKTTNNTRKKTKTNNMKRNMKKMKIGVEEESTLQ